MPKKPEETLASVLEAMDIPSDIVEKLNSGEYEDDTFKGAFDEIFIAKKMAKSDEGIRKAVVGEITRKITGHLQKGFEMAAADIDGKTVEEVFDIGMGLNKTKITDLEAKIENPPTDNKEELEKAQKDLGTMTEKATKSEADLMAANKTIADNQEKFDGTIKKSQVNMLLHNEKSKINFKDDINEVEKIGFNGAIQSSYNFDIENDVLIVTDKEGNKVQNEKKTDFLDAPAVLAMEAVKYGLAKQNKGPAGPAPTPAPGTPPVDPPEGKTVKLHPAAAKHVVDLKEASSS